MELPMASQEAASWFGLVDGHHSTGQKGVQKIVKIVVVKRGALSYLMAQVHRFWCEGKPVLPSNA
jgi:hypothetical protein